MSRRKLLLISAATLAFTAAFITVATQVRPAREITVSIAGDSNQEITATFVVDGKKHEESLTTPVKRSFNASTLHFWVARQPNPRKPVMTVETTIEGKVFGTAEAVESDQCAYGGICTASMFGIRREKSYTHPAPPEVVAQLVTPPRFPNP